MAGEIMPSVQLSTLANVSSKLLPAVPRRRGLAKSPCGTRSNVSTNCGEIEGGLALVGQDRKNAFYALRIINRSSSPLRARVTGARRRSNAGADALDVEMAPFSVSETLFPLARAHATNQAIVKISGCDLAFTLSAPLPNRKKSGWPLVAAGMLSLALGIGAFAGLSSPALPVLAAPARAQAGRALEIPYAFGGWASMRYALVGSNGTQLSAGLTSRHAGVLRFATTALDAGKKVRLDATVFGPFGLVHESRAISLRSGSNPLQSVSGLRVAQTVHAGEDLPVRYTVASKGQMWLLDPYGKIWDSAVLSPSGETTLHVPVAAGGRDLRVVVQGKGAYLSADVMALPSQIAAPQSPSAPSGSSPLSLSSYSARAGSEVGVRVSGMVGGAVLLTDLTGALVQRAAIGATGLVYLRAPSVTSPTSFYVIAQAPSGAGEESAVKRLTVLP